MDDKPPDPDSGKIIEISVEVDAEAAEAVSELFNRYNGGGYDDDNEKGAASGGGAIIEITGFDDFAQPIEGEYRTIVKTLVKPDERGRSIRQQIEIGLGHLSAIYPIPEPKIRTVKQEDWAHAWKKFYKPFRIGKRVLLKPAWEEIESRPDEIVIELEPGMAFGTGMHPTTRLCVEALDRIVQPGDHVLDVGTGSGILSILAAKLGAASVHATDIDSIAVESTLDNLQRNDISIGAESPVFVEKGSIPAGVEGKFHVVVANILAEVIVKLFDGEYDNVPLAEPLSPTGTLILSGILDEKADMVKEAAARHGLEVIEMLQETDWVALIAKPVK